MIKKLLNVEVFPESNTEMSLRDYFAGQVATGWLSGVIIDGDVGYTLQEPEVLARKFYAIADAMLAERNRQ